MHAEVVILMQTGGVGTGEEVVGVDIAEERIDGDEVVASQKSISSVVCVREAPVRLQIGSRLAVEASALHAVDQDV